MVLERWTNPKLSRRTCTCEYGLQSCSGKSAGVAKRPRERSPARNPYRFDSQLLYCCMKELRIWPSLVPHAGCVSSGVGGVPCQPSSAVSAHASEKRPSPRQPTDW